MWKNWTARKIRQTACTIPWRSAHKIVRPVILWALRRGSRQCAPRVPGKLLLGTVQVSVLYFTQTMQKALNSLKIDFDTVVNRMGTTSLIKKRPRILPH